MLADATSSALPQWVISLISALAGLATGLIAEPFKNQIQFWMVFRRIKNVLAHNLEYEIEWLIKLYEVPQTLDSCIPWKFPTFTFYYKKYTEHFFAYRVLGQFRVTIYLSYQDSRGRIKGP